VNAITSIHTLLPLDYYDVPFCAPQGGAKLDKQNLGENLAGDRIQSSPYYLLMKKDMYCEQLCVSDLGTSPNKASEVIQKNYHINWIVDNLPAGSKMEDESTITTRYWQGSPIGFVHSEDEKFYIHNHVNIEISYRKVETKPQHYRVVRFIVEPFSIRHEYDSIAGTEEDLDIDSDNVLPKIAKIKNPMNSCRPGNKAHTTYDMVTEDGRQMQPASGQVLFTYDVIWTETREVSWASRWDIYLYMDYAVPNSVHWMSLANSVVLFMILLAILATALVRCFRKERNQYNSLATDDESARQVENHGWIAVRGDVFRPPTFLPTVFAAICGTGAQLMSACSVIITFAALGFMSPARRGHFIMGALITFASMGIVAGYVSARLSKTFKLGNWTRVTTLTAVGFPGIVFCVFFVINMIERFHQSTKTVPFSTWIALSGGWLCVSAPLVFLGAGIGFKCDHIEFPFEPVDDECRQLPRGRPWYAGVFIFLLRFFFFDIIPFGAIFVEFYYVLASTWMGYSYYAFGYMMLTLYVAAFTCAVMAVVITYFRIRRENYRWWWSSLTTAGAVGVYAFLYSILYFQQLEAIATSANVQLPDNHPRPWSFPQATRCIFFGYMALVSLGLAFMFGSVGVLASLCFTKQMYSSLRRDRPSLVERQTELIDQNSPSEEDENSTQTTSDI
jgi:transmembrane 9 superfamily protein 2/4